MAPRTSHVAQRWVARQAGGNNPHIPVTVIQDVKNLSHQLGLIHSNMRGLAPHIYQLWGQIQDAQETAKTAWVAQGNHPDDFNDPHMSPDGVMYEQASEFCEDLYSLLDSRESSSMTSKIGDMAEHMEEMWHKV